MLEDVQSLWYELRGLIHGLFRLAVLETQRACKNLLDMIFNLIFQLRLLESVSCLQL